jgi:hypothetical protein
MSAPHPSKESGTLVASSKPACIAKGGGGMSKLVVTPKPPTNGDGNHQSESGDDSESSSSSGTDTSNDSDTDTDTDTDSDSGTDSDSTSSDSESQSDSKGPRVASNKVVVPGPNLPPLSSPPHTTRMVTVSTCIGLSRI